MQQRLHWAPTLTKQNKPKSLPVRKNKRVFTPSMDTRSAAPSLVRRLRLPLTQRDDKHPAIVRQQFTGANALATGATQRLSGLQSGNAERMNAVACGYTGSSRAHGCRSTTWRIVSRCASIRFTSERNGTSGRMPAHHSGCGIDDVLVFSRWRSRSGFSLSAIKRGRTASGNVLEHNTRSTFLNAQSGHQGAPDVRRALKAFRLQS
jgi:hypothetical protein